MNNLKLIVIGLVQGLVISSLKLTAILAIVMPYIVYKIHIPNGSMPEWAEWSWVTAICISAGYVQYRFVGVLFKMIKEGNRAHKE